ncbi:MAG TPA: hypothetical protein VGS10_08610 [Terracidiphilus sp.]|nr:hypothetical protein [Terracidiphilus sp.]
MKKKYLILIGIVAVAVILIVRYFAVGHQTPSGQPQLLAITPQNVPQFAAEFNRSRNVERVVLLMSPTCPVCLEGSSSIEAILRRHPGNNIRIFAVWEPMLPTDWGRPSTDVMARLSDPRVTQFWDSHHLIARLVEKGADGRRPACCSINGNWWDVIATYPPTSKWTASAPVPELLNGTIVHTAPELRSQLEQHSS